MSSHLERSGFECPSLNSLVVDPEQINSKKISVTILLCDQSIG